MAIIHDSWAKMTGWQKSLIILSCGLVLYSAFGFLLLPRIARYVLVEKVSPVLSRQVGVEEIRFNPFTLTADVKGFSIREREGDGDFVAFDALHADLELSSVVRMAVVVRELRLDGPRMRIRLNENGQTNFADLSGAPEEPAPERKRPTIVPLVIEPVTVGNGTLVFEDQARGVTHVVDEINFNLPQFSSRKKDWTTFMTPTLSFRVNGAPFNLEGQTIPFDNSLKTEFALNVVDLDLPQYWAYALARENLQLARGSLSLENKLVFERHEDALPTFSLQGTITGRDIELTDNGDPVLSAPKSELVLEDISILNLRLGLRSVTLEQPFVKLVRGKDGNLNWMGYFTPEPGAANATAANATVAAPRSPADGNNATAAVPSPASGEANSTAGLANATVAATGGPAAAKEPANATATPVRTLLLQAPEVRILDGRILFRDETTSSPFTKDVNGLDLTVTDLSTAVNATTSAALSAQTADGEEIGLNATFSVTPLRSEARINARNLDIPSYAPYFRDALPMTLASARADALLNLVMESQDAAPRLHDSRIEVRDLILKASGEAGAIKVGSAALNDIFVNMAGREVGTGVLEINNTEVSTGVDRNGRATILATLESPGSAKAPKESPAPSADNSTAWRVSTQGASVGNLKLAISGKAPATPVRLGSLKIGPVSVDTAKTSVAVGPVDLNLAVDVTRLKNGDIDLATLFAPAEDGATKPKNAAKAKTAARARKPSPAWDVAVQALTLSGSKVTFTDETLDKPARVDIDQIAFSTKNLSTDLDKAIPLNLTCRIEESGTIKASGDIVPSTLVTKGRVDLARIPLSLASAYIADAAAVDIPSGRLGGRLNWRMGGKGRDQLSGSLNVDGLRVTEARSKSEIAGLRSLDLEQISLQLSPLALSIGAVNLLEPRAGFVIDSQGRTTIDRITPRAKKPAAGKPAKGGASEGLKSLEIASFSMQQGRFTFTDQTISPQFASVISPVDLNVRGISLDPQKKADIDLSAVIDGSAPISATGWISPLKDPVETNSTVTLRNLDLVALSPYSAKFIAYPVAQGQLDWDMNLSTEGSNLAMRNAIKARQLELGDKVESPDAVNAPVKLGLALLRDMSGNIAINLPVKGDLNDPKFSIGGIVLQAFLGLIVKAVASPFSLLASLVPEGGADMSKLDFPPGLVTPAEETMNGIRALGDVLKQRPGISISIVGRADPAADRQAMADSQFLRKLQVVKYDGLSRKEREGVVLEELKISDEEYADVLWEAYKEEPVEKKKNFLGIHEDVPREEQEAKLRERIEVTDEHLIRLAADRAEFVKNQLVQVLGVDAARVFLGGTGPQSLSGAHEVTVEIRK